MTDTYGLIGHPLGHSFSRAFFTEKFQREGIEAEYRNFDIERADMLLDVVRDTPNLRGLNCTIPHKQAIVGLMHSLSPEAQRIGAVNVVKVMPDGSLQGHNSDVYGFMESIRPLLQDHHKQALVLGTGGASKAVCVGLEELGIQWRYVSRTPREGQLSYDDLTSEIIETHTVVVNCTPLGMHPNVDQCPPLPYHRFTPSHIAYDLLNNPMQPNFLSNAAEAGASTKNGLEMLHLQALKSWQIWNS